MATTEADFTRELVLPRTLRGVDTNAELTTEARELSDAFEGIFTTATAAAEKARVNGKFSPGGLEEVRRELATGAISEVEKLVESRAGPRQRQLKTAQSVLWTAFHNAPRLGNLSPEAAARIKSEIREEFRRLDPLDAGIQLREAVEAGDLIVLLALLEMPATLSIVPRADLEREALSAARALAPEAAAEAEALEGFVEFVQSNAKEVVRHLSEFGKIEPGLPEIRGGGRVA